MKYLKSFLGRVSAFVCALSLVPAAAHAAYAGTTFDAVQEVADDATIFFGVVVVLAVLVTGFFVGRKWLRSVG
jgi:hypothetical protein